MSVDPLSSNGYLADRHLRRLQWPINYRADGERRDPVAFVLLGVGASRRLVTGAVESFDQVCDQHVESLVLRFGRPQAFMDGARPMSAPLPQ
jgi:hypothetical protein